MKFCILHHGFLLFYIALWPYWIVCSLVRPHQVNTYYRTWVYYTAMKSKKRHQFLVYANPNAASSY